MDASRTIIELDPPSFRARAWLFAFTVALPMLGLAAVFAWQGAPRPWWPGTGIHLLDRATTVLAPMLVLLAVWLLTMAALRRHRIELRDGTLVVVAGWQRAKLAPGELQLDQARVGALDEHPEWKPWLKSSGMVLPGFRAGWFRTRGFARVFACITDGERVLWIPTARKHALLLQPAKPNQLLERLRGMTAAPARR